MPTIREFRANMSFYLSNLPISLFKNKELIAHIVSPDYPIDKYDENELVEVGDDENPGKIKNGDKNE